MSALQKSIFSPHSIEWASVIGKSHVRGQLKDICNHHAESWVQKRDAGHGASANRIQSCTLCLKRNFDWTIPLRFDLLSCSPRSIEWASAIGKSHVRGQLKDNCNHRFLRWAQDKMMFSQYFARNWCSCQTSVSMLKTMLWGDFFPVGWLFPKPAFPMGRGDFTPRGVT